MILAGSSVALTAGLGLRRRLHSTALGKVLLAWRRRARTTCAPNWTASADRVRAE
ncbi:MULTISPECIES: IclR family transcriptional regulator C-terminal domain-containing protein [Actinomycetes]|uniref:IclR family transcriptional regulator C-terminal domain-containing protein n=1 Tax=Actinomycetes TaxID=1760 RepID=UPI0001B55B46|nr:MULTISPECIES: IclR family transcriptional regulator C-terminal domain-containing protein [Actinomycetes]